MAGFECGYCGLSYSTAQAIRNHFMTAHMEMASKQILDKKPLDGKKKKGNENVPEEDEQPLNAIVVDVLAIEPPSQPSFDASDSRALPKFEVNIFQLPKINSAVRTSMKDAFSSVLAPNGKQGSFNSASATPHPPQLSKPSVPATSNVPSTSPSAPLPPIRIDPPRVFTTNKLKKLTSCKMCTMQVEEELEWLHMRVAHSVDLNAYAAGIFDTAPHFVRDFVASPPKKLAIPPKSGLYGQQKRTAPVRGKMPSPIRIDLTDDEA